METITNKLFENSNFNCTNIEYIITNLEKLQIENINLCDKEYSRIFDVVFIDEYTVYEHPLVVNIQDKTLYINPDWYEKNLSLVTYLIEYIAMNTRMKELSICNAGLISNQVVDKLCSNKYLELVDLGQYNNDGYILSYDDYLKFKESTIKRVNSKDVDEKLKETFDPIIGYSYRHLIAGYRYDELSNNDNKYIFLDKVFTSDELDNLKYISQGKEIYLSGKNIEQYKIICNKLNELGKNNDVVLDVKARNKKDFNEFIFNEDINYDNLYVCPNFNPIPIKKYLQLEKLLYSIVGDAKNLSPFEQYIYVYNIAKKYKKYKESSNITDARDSRDLYSILENDYMVCVGFSSLFGDLLDKLEIPNKYIDFNVDISYDNVKSDGEISIEPKEVKYAGHARRYVHIVDQKYGIDGYYIADPTWDNDLNNDYYNHLAMTDNELTYTRRYNKMNINDVSELFNVNSLQEMYSKTNFLLEKNKKDPIFDLKHVVHELVSTIKIMDVKFIDELTKKYNYLQGDLYQYPDDVSDVLYDLGNYIVDHVNKEISGETIMQAVSEVYRKCHVFPEDRIQYEIEKTIKDNKVRQASSFPKRNKYYADGTIVEDSEYKNKFDFANIKEEHKSL